MADQPFQHPAHCPEGGFIEIRPGDTLYSISRFYGTTVEAIIRANPGINPANLPVGQLICVPTPGRPFPQPCPNGTPYTIKAGDTFYAIARRFNITIAALTTANPGVNPAALRIGQQICVPTLHAPCPGPTYTVRAGDTLFAIARTHGVSVQSILTANPGINPNLLEVGQILCLPVR